VSDPSKPRKPFPARRVFTWVLAVAALSFVSYMIPVRDRCWDARAAESTHVAVSRMAQGCLLHLRSGDVTIGAEECAQLHCEPGLVSTFARARLGLLAGLLGVYGVSLLAWASRWRALLSFAGIDLAVSKVWRILIEAQAGGVLLPGGLGSDALRTAAVLSRPTRPGQTRSPVAIVVSSVLLDRAIGMSLITGLAAIIGVLSGGVQAGPLLSVLGAVPLVVLGGFVILRRAPASLADRLSRGRAGKVVQPVLAYLRDPRAPRAIAIAVAFGVANSLLQFVVVRGIVFALGATPVDEKWVYVGVAMAFVVTAIPSLPGGWGTADATYVYFFGLGGIPSSVALATCLLFRLFWYATAVLGAVLQLGGRPKESEGGARLGPGMGS
jgi:uncharacterized membrane protein YbhN (UPF0104 family)